MDSFTRENVFLFGGIHHGTRMVRPSRFLSKIQKRVKVIDFLEGQRSVHREESRVVSRSSTFLKDNGA